MQDSRREIPSVDRLVRLEAIESLVAVHGRILVLETMRVVLQEYRASMTMPGATEMGEAWLVTQCAERLRCIGRASLRPVFNLTGTVLHTNLGRALLPSVAVDAAMQAMSRPVNLEFDVASGKRGERDEHVEQWLQRLTGAEAATVVNNNAAAVLIALNTIAPRKDVIVSRGELVEIGGAFRIPDIMAHAGCRLREVGTTNRTHSRDYVQAIGKRTAAIMKVHTSNYAIQGFTASVPERELAALAHEHALPLLNDLGSGTLINLEDYDLPHEPTPREAIANGADIVTFSGDKLLGGPQCGLIVGRKDLIEKIRRNPLKRALRVDKIITAALEATLRIYADPRRLARELPTLRLIMRPRAEIEALAHRILPALTASTAGWASATVVPCMSQIGSGSLPMDLLPSVGTALTPLATRKRSAADLLATAFRNLPIPAIGHVQNGKLTFDLRCLEDEAGFVAQLHQLAPPEGWG